MKPCSVCKEIEGDGETFGPEYSLLVETGKNLIGSTDNFVIVPSIGALNASHCMIVPRIHINNLAMVSLELQGELSFIKGRIADFVNRRLGKEIVFVEHGTGIQFDASGGCVAHAHLHAITYLDGFESAFLKGVRPIPISDFDHFKKIADVSAGYIYYQGSGQLQYLKNCPHLPPQFFRYLYAQAQTWPTNWNWRFDYRIEEVRNVIEFYRSLYGNQ